MFVMTHSSTQVLPELQHFSNTDDSMLTPPNIVGFWKLETGITPQEEKEHDETVMEHFKKSVKKEDGRYYVVWPWKMRTANFLKIMNSSSKDLNHHRND